jgi:hypothetical protein
MFPYIIEGPTKLPGERRKAIASYRQRMKRQGLLRDRIATRRAKGLKALLADGPLDDIDLERARDIGRDALRVSSS